MTSRREIVVSRARARAQVVVAPALAAAVFFLAGAAPGVSPLVDIEVRCPPLEAEQRSALVARAQLDLAVRQVQATSMLVRCDEAEGQWAAVLELRRAVGVDEVRIALAPGTDVVEVLLRALEGLAVPAPVAPAPSSQASGLSLPPLKSTSPATGASPDRHRPQWFALADAATDAGTTQGLSLGGHAGFQLGPGRRASTLHFTGGGVLVGGRTWAWNPADVRVHAWEVTGDLRASGWEDRIELSLAATATRLFVAAPDEWSPQQRSAWVWGSALRARYALGGASARVALGPELRLTLARAVTEMQGEESFVMPRWALGLGAELRVPLFEVGR